LGRPERRRAPRAETNHHVALILAEMRETTPAILKNISESGCFFESPTEVLVGWPAAITFHSDLHGTCDAVGKIVRLAQGSGFGVQFQYTNGALRNLVATLLRASPEERSSILKNAENVEIHLG
jgi:hypothetical protein